MNTLATTLSTRELRANLSDVLGRASYGGERIGVTKNGRLTAIVIGVEDLLALEELEDARDLAAFREAVRDDDGQRVSLATCALNSTTSDALVVTVVRVAHRREVYRS